MSNSILIYVEYFRKDRIRSGKQINNLEIIQLNMNSFTSLSSKIDLNNPEVRYVKQLTPTRWKQLMIAEIESMMKKYDSKTSLLIDLKTIVNYVPESSFVQSVLEIQPFKPEFVQQKFLEPEVTESTVASTITKAAKFKGEGLKSKEATLRAEKVTQKTLKSQFNKEYHPYHYIIKNFGRWLELKFKSLIDNKKITDKQVFSRLKQDLVIFQEFIKQSCAPYLKIFKLEANEEGTKIALKKMNKFIDNYISEHQKLNSTIHKIVIYAVRKQHGQFFSKQIKDFVTPDEFDIHPDFQIDGSYIRSINSLIEFSETNSAQAAMKKLVEFRVNMLKDIDEYYLTQHGETKELEMNAEIQIEIIRYIVCKLKNWACQVYGQLKFLEIVYGEEEIAYKYEEVSFMYSQLLMAFEIVGVST